MKLNKKSGKVPVSLRTSVLILATALSGGCSERDQRAAEDFSRRGVTINYTQTHRCGTLVVAGQPNQPGPVTYQEGPLVVFTIDSIANQQPAAIPFQFEADRLFAKPSLSSRAIRVLRPEGTTVITPGTTWTTGGLVIIKLDPPDSPPPSPTTGLGYEQHGGDPPVLMIGRGRRVTELDSCRLSDLPQLPVLP